MKMKNSVFIATSLDGYIADKNGEIDWLYSIPNPNNDGVGYIEFIKDIDALVMGRTTFETLPGKLPGRLHVILSRKAGDWDEKEKNVVFTSLNPAKILEKLESLGFDKSILAGGAIINTLFAKENLIDEMIITVSPMVFGSGLGVFSEEISLDLDLQKVEPLGENSATFYYMIKK